MRETLQVCYKAQKNCTESAQRQCSKSKNSLNLSNKRYQCQNCCRSHHLICKQSQSGPEIKQKGEGNTFQTMQFKCWIVTSYLPKCKSRIIPKKKKKKKSETKLTATVLKKRSKTHKRLKERFLIGRNRTKRANFRCIHLLFSSRQSRALFLPPAFWHPTDKDKLVFNCFLLYCTQLEKDDYIENLHVSCSV